MINRQSLIDGLIVVPFVFLGLLALNWLQGDELNVIQFGIFAVIAGVVKVIWAEYKLRMAAKNG